MSDEHVLWHDLECGSYDADLPLWRLLAAEAAGPVLDVGSGSGRVTLDLARRGHEVVALDGDPALLRALRERAGDLPVETFEGDARTFDAGRTFGLVIVPMQTVQLLEGQAGRAAFLTRARAHLQAGGVLAMAIADVLEGVGGDLVEPPLPDVREVAGVVYSSRPVAVREDGARVAIERVRERVDAAGTLTVTESVDWLDALDAPQLEREGAAAGLRVLARREVPADDEYVGSAVVMLGA